MSQRYERSPAQWRVYDIAWRLKRLQLRSSVGGDIRTVPGDGSIVRHGCDNLAVLPDIVLLAFVIHISPHVPVELHVNRNVVTRKLPWVEVQPVVWNLNLVSIDDLLLKYAVAVSQGVSPSWIVECGKGIEEAGSQAPETAVTKCCITLKQKDTGSAIVSKL